MKFFSSFIRTTICIGIFALCSFFAATKVSAAEMGQETADFLYNSVKSSYKNTTYDEFYDMLAPYVSTTDKLNIQIQLQRELGRTPTEDEILARIKQVYTDKLGLRASFDDVMTNLDVILPNLLANSETTTATYLTTNRTRILFGLTYLDKYYSFPVAETTARDILLYTPEMINRSPQDPLTIVGSIGNINYTGAKANKTAEIYTNYISWVTGIDEVSDFLETLAALEGEITASDYFKSTSKAVIKETSADADFFAKAKTDARLKTFLLPLLSLSSDSLYLISTDYTITIGLTSTYGGADSDGFKETLNAVALSQQSFLDFWQRMSTTSDALKLATDLLVIDTLAVAGQEGQTISQRWSAEYGSSADPGVAEFITPMGYYRSYMFIGAEADASGNLIQFFVDPCLTNTGIATYTHELTHIYDETVWLNGAGRRTNVGNETFAKGLFETENNTQLRDGGDSTYAPIFSLNTAYSLGDNRIQNKTPERFRTSEDIKEYMQGVMDIVYTLDIIEAQEILKMSDADKALLFNRVSLVDDPSDTQNLGRKADCFSNITAEEAAKLKTIDDLVDQNIVSGRLIPKGSSTTQTLTYNDYIVVPMFEGVFAGIQNNDGATGDFLFRRYAYELLAEYGWEDGFIAYISDEYPNDKEALAAILDETYAGDMPTFKKAMLQRRCDNMENLKSTATYADSDAIRLAIRDALQKDLASIKEGIAGGTSYYMLYVNEVQNLKADIFKEYLLMTNDFDTSVYKETSDEPNDEPSDEPGDEPSDEPSDEPNDEPSDEPGDEPSDEPSDEPDDEPGDTDIDNPVPSPAPAKNTIIIDKKSGVSYKVTSAQGSNRSVTYQKPKNKKVKKVSVPDTVTIGGYTYKVTGIAKNAFKGCVKLKKVTIGKHVASIGIKAFYGCKNLKTIIIKTKKLKLSKVGRQAFKGIYSEPTVKVPKNKFKAYKKIMKKRGAGKKVNYRKI